MSGSNSPRLGSWGAPEAGISRIRGFSRPGSPTAAPLQGCLLPPSPSLVTTIHVVHPSRKPQYGGGLGTPGASPGTHGELVPRAGREVSESRGRADPGQPPGAGESRVSQTWGARDCPTTRAAAFAAAAAAARAVARAPARVAAI